jgi:hypothetical protein
MPLKLCLVLPVVLSASMARGEEQTPPQFRQLLACRTIADREARLDCLERATAALNEAVAERSIMIVDQAAAQAAKRQQFGAPRPRPTSVAAVPELARLETTLKSASVDERGAWIFRLADGGVWIQTDDYQLPGSPRSGEKVTVRRGTLGSFRLAVGNRPAVKVRRKN